MEDRLTSRPSRNSSRGETDSSGIMRTLPDSVASGATVLNHNFLQPLENKSAPLSEMTQSISLQFGQAGNRQLDLRSLGSSCGLVV